MPETTLADVVAIMEGLYPPSLAASWDAVGLVCGDPAQRVRRILFAVDPVAVVVDEAIERGADLLITHHPLFLHGTSSVAATTAKGRSVHRLIRAGIALHVAHTNADHANPGVSDALAAALGLVDTRPLEPLPAPQLDKVVTFVPEAHAEKLLDALAAAGAGEIGDYARCAWTAVGVGTFVPRPGATPAIGAVGDVTRVDETRIEMVLPRASRDEVIHALRAAHPYEEPAFDVLELASWPGDTGTGRVGELPESTTLRDFASTIAAALPSTAGGGRIAGDLGAVVRRVAACGGAGDGYLRQASASGSDVFVTADLRHHVVSEHLADGGCAVVDMPHWATEWPWLGAAADAVRAALTQRGTTVSTDVSTMPTDPWVARVDAGTRKDPH
ncbi:MAG TPA: Nif3-like dinuclear metal center hexameric protein [Acidothermaceae bacterium]